MLVPRLKADSKSSFQLSKSQISIIEQIEDKLRNNQYCLIMRNCPLCDEAKNDVVAEKDRFGLSVTTVLCYGCGLLYTNPVMRLADYEHFYKNYYRELYSENKEGTQSIFESQSRHGNSIYRFLSMKGLKKKGLVLEIGCGCGGILAAFRDRDHPTIGYDLNQDFLFVGQKKLLDLRVGTILDHPINQLVDVIIYSHVLEHVLNIQEELEEISTRLKEDGLLYVECPGILSIPKNYLRDLQLYLQNAHLVHFNLNLLVGMLAKNGFELVEGNEKVEAVFKKAKKQSVRPNEKLAVTDFLVRNELKYNTFFARIKKITIMNLSLIFRTIGLYDLAKDLYKKLNF